jgi:hypothetical protein
MKEIANLARIVTLRRSSNRPLLDLDAAPPGKEERLMQSIVAKPDVSAVQLTKTLYGNNSAASQTALRKLRARVQDKLLNHLFFLDYTDARLLVSRRFELGCLDLVHKATILFLEGEYQLCERLLRRCIKLALDNEFTLYAELATQRLRTLYADRGDSHQYKIVDKELQQLRQVQEWEREAEQILLDVRLAMFDTVARRRATVPKVPAYLTRLEELHDKAQTFNTFYALYRLQLIYAEMTGRYDEMIRYTGEASQLLAQGKLNAHRFDKRFNNFASILAHLRARQAPQGLRLAEEYVHDIHPTSSNWFYFYEHFVLLALHAADYEKALRLLQVAHKNPSYQKQRPAALMQWELLEAYIELVQPPDRLLPNRRSQLTVFAAINVPEYTRDKRGYNVAILIFQLLHYLQQRVLEPVLSRLERLRKYQQRHLRDKEATRSRTFLRLLLLLPEAHFDPDELEERSQKLLGDLREAPLMGEAEAQIEIIPYEDLWEFTLSTLRKGAPE